MTEEEEEKRIRKPTTGGIPKEVLLERERRAWDLRQQGLTHERIAAELNLDRSTITKMLGRLSVRASKNMMEMVIEEKIGQIARLNHIVDEAMQAWERSKETAKTVRRQQADAAAQEEGDVEGSARKKKVTTTTLVQDQDGDPRYLDVAIKAMNEIRKILGLDAPAKNLNVDLSTLTDEQLDRLVKGEDVLSVLMRA